MADDKIKLAQMVESVCEKMVEKALDLYQTTKFWT